jgi:hypothetical protein
MSQLCTNFSWLFHTYCHKSILNILICHTSVPYVMVIQPLASLTLFSMMWLVMMKCNTFLVLSLWWVGDGTDHNTVIFTKRLLYRFFASLHIDIKLFNTYWSIQHFICSHNGYFTIKMGEIILLYIIMLISHTDNNYQYLITKVFVILKYLCYRVQNKGIL